MIPTVAIVLLLLLPFFDKRERVPVRKRPVALCCSTSLSVLAIVTLTILGGRSPKLESPSEPSVKQSESPSNGANQSEDATPEEDSDDTPVFDFN